MSIKQKPTIKGTKNFEPTSWQRGDGLVPGTEVTRKYKGRELRVLVLQEGVQFEGEKYTTLSARSKPWTPNSGL